MSDRYLTIAAIAADECARKRFTACAAQQGVSEPERWVLTFRWRLAASPGWAEAWDYAVNTGVEEPGCNDAVITDMQILSAVQALL